MESRQQEVKRLTDENQALKTRVKLLEEGQTKDLTILVGQKVEEGASSEEVKGKCDKKYLDWDTFFATFYLYRASRATEIGRGQKMPNHRGV